MSLVTHKMLKDLIAAQPPLSSNALKLDGSAALFSGGIKRESKLSAYLARDHSNVLYPPVETKELLDKVKTALDVLDPDDFRGNAKQIDFDDPKNTWLTIVWAVASLKSDKAKELLREWSRQSEKYNEEEFEAAYTSYDPLYCDKATSEIRPIKIWTLYKLAKSKSPTGMAKLSEATPLAEIQTLFCVIDLGGILYILDRNQLEDVLSGDGNKPVNYYKRPEGCLKIERFIQSQHWQMDGKEIKAALHTFLRSPRTVIYESVAFHPLPQPVNVLNFWRPPAIVPKAGKCDTIDDFLIDVICSGDRTNLQWLLKFLAHMLQKPEEKPGVAVIFLGGQGTGKGALYELLKTIWANTMTQVHDVDDVIGKFTAAALERNFAVWMDEALFTHDKRAIERLKATITEREINIEEKFQPKRTMKSHHRFFAASNNEHFANVDADDRRFFFLRVSDCHKQDAEYFSKYFAALTDGTSVPGFVHALLQLDITGFNVRERPKTIEHGQQKIKSLNGIRLFFYQALQTAKLPPGEFSMQKSWNDSMTIKTEAIKDSFRFFDKNAERYRPIVDSQFVPEIKLIFPSAKSTRWQINGQQQRGVNLPSLPDAREEFEACIGFKVEWEAVDVDLVE